MAARDASEGVPAMSEQTDDPTTLTTERARVRGSAQSHGAATDPEAIRAFVRATARRRAASASTALRVSLARRGYTRAEHDQAEALREQGREAEAAAIVPLEHAREGWR